MLEEASTSHDSRGWGGEVGGWGVGRGLRIKYKPKRLGGAWAQSIPFGFGDFIVDYEVLRCKIPRFLDFYIPEVVFFRVIGFLHSWISGAISEFLGSWLPVSQNS